jgi:hypothetical protein
MYTELMIGFLGGIWFASRYDCRPYVDRLRRLVEEKLPESRDSKND